MRSSALTWCWWSRGDRWRGRTVKRARSSRRSGCKTRTHTQFLARTSARAGLSPLATGLSLASPRHSGPAKPKKSRLFTRLGSGGKGNPPAPGLAKPSANSADGMAWLVTTPRRAPRPARRSARRAPPGSQSAAPTAGPQDGRRQARSITPAAPALSPDSPPPRESGAPASGLPAGARRRRLPAAPAACEGWGGS